MEAQRFSHQALLLDDGRILVSGGFIFLIGPIHWDTIDIYNPRTGQWSTTSPEGQTGLLSSGFRQNRALKLPDGTVLFVGVHGDGSYEQDTGAAYRLDTADLSWTQLADPPTARAFHQMILLGDGRVMVAGGIDLNEASSSLDAEPTNTVDIFDPATNTWQQVAPMRTGSQGLWLFLLNDGRVLSISREDENFNDSPTHAQIYDPDSDTWTVVDSYDPTYLPTGAVQLSDGRVLVTGQLNESTASARGRTSDGELFYVRLPDGREFRGDQLRDAKVYDPATDTWTATLGSPGFQTATPSFSFGCSAFSCGLWLSASLTLLKDGRVLMAGGGNELERGYGFASLLSSATAVYDPESNFWSPGPNLTERRSDHSTTLMPDGWIFILGGIGLREVAEGSEVLYPLNTLEAIDSTAMPLMDAVALTIPRSDEYSCEAIPIPEPSADLAPADESLSPKDILGAAHAAMRTLDSYHVELRETVVSTTLEFGPDNPAANPTAECTRGMIDFQSPDRVREHYSSYDHWSEVYHSVGYIFIGADSYGTHPRTGEWERGGSWIPENPANPLGLIGDDAIANLQDASIDGVERLNDVDVYRISGTVSSRVFSKEIPRNAYFTIHRPLQVVFFVGVDDSLVRKLYAEGGVEGAQFSRHYSIVVEYSAFDEEIVIEAPEAGTTP